MHDLGLNIPTPINEWFKRFTYVTMNDSCGYFEPSGDFSFSRQSSTSYSRNRVHTVQVNYLGRWCLSFELDHDHTGVLIARIPTVEDYQFTLDTEVNIRAFLIGSNVGLGSITIFTTNSKHILTSQN